MTSDSRKGIINFPPSHAESPALDYIFKYQFYRPLSLRNPSLPYKGYIRALQLYGREENFGGRGPQSKRRFINWANKHAGVLEAYRHQAIQEGYSPLHGYSDFGNSTYYQNEDDFYLRAGETPPRQETDIHHRNERDQSAYIHNNSPALGNPQDPNTPQSLQNLSGSLILDKDNAKLSAVGSAEIAFSLSRVLEDVVEGKDIDVEEVREVLKFLGGSERLFETVEFFRKRVTPSQNASVGRQIKVHQENNLTESGSALIGDKNTFTMTTPTHSTKHKAAGFSQSFREITNENEKSYLAHANPSAVSNNPVIVKTPVRHGDMTYFAYMLYAKNQVMVLFNPAVANDIGTFFAGCRTIIHEDFSLREAVQFLGIDPDFVAEFDFAMHTVMLEDPSVTRLIEDSRKLDLFRNHKAINELCTSTCEKMDEIGWDRDVSRVRHTKRHLDSEDPADRFVMAKPVAKQATSQGQAWGVKTVSRASKNYTFELPHILDAMDLENKPWDQYGVSPQAMRLSKMG